MRLILALLLMATTAQAQVIGVDCLTCFDDRFQGRNCTRYIQSFKHAPEVHTAWLWDLFGNNQTCARRLIHRYDEVKPISAEIHPTCGPCRRQPQFYGKLTPPGDRKTLLRIYAFAQRYPQVDWLLSLELEDNFTRKEARNVYRKVVEIWPYRTVRNPLRGNYRAGADLLELHGSSARCPYVTPGGKRSTIADLDGHELHGAELDAYIAANQYCAYVRVWFCSPQGTCAGYRALADRIYHFGRQLVAELRKIFIIGD